MQEDQDLKKIHQELQRLRTDLIAVSTSLSTHRHLSYDSTATLKPVYRRQQLVDQATINSDATQSEHFYVTLAGNRTLAAPIGALGGQRIIWEFIQDSTGSRTITLNSIFNTGGFTITLTTTANKRDFMESVYSDVDNKFYIVNFVKNY